VAARVCWQDVLARSGGEMAERRDDMVVTTGKARSAA
jgi:hypothetical protein